MMIFRIEPGTTLDDRFEMERKLGAGAMGEVWLARQISTDRPVVVKLIKSDIAEEPGARERFQKEARVVARLSHPNIVKVLDTGQTAHGILWISMEFIDGMDIDKLMRTLGPTMPLAAKLRICFDIAEGLQYAHDQGVIHRDLKPSNVMITPKTGFVQLVDFGIARIYRQGVTPSSMSAAGTPNYMAPESINGQLVTPATDVFALGAMMYEMTANGVRPFEAETWQGTLYKTVHEEPPPLRSFNPNVPPVLEAIIHRCLAKQPEARYVSVADLLQDLDACEDGEAGRLFKLQKFLGHARTLSFRPPTITSEGMVPVAVPRSTVTVGSARGELSAPLTAPGKKSAKEAGSRRARLFSVAAIGAVLVGVGIGALMKFGGADPAALPTDETLRAATHARERAVSSDPPARTPASGPPTAVAMPIVPDAGLAAVSTPDAAVQAALPPASPPPAKPEEEPSRPSPARERRGPPGELVVSSKTWAEVRVDGKRVGDAPLRVNLAPGRYSITMSNDQLKQQKRVRVEIKAGKPTEIHAGW